MANLMYALSVETFIPVLNNLSDLLDKASAQKGAEAETLVEARLAPDMFPLPRQVQIACDMAKSCAARLSGGEPPKFEDDEKTLAELKARIVKTIGFIESVPASAFQGAETRQIAFPLRDDMSLRADGLRFLKDWCLPNFYFHVVTAYDILRHKGVEIGKPDYLAHSGDLILRAA
jgi:uncharacterized protein